jgi:hypothetical protein
VQREQGVDLPQQLLEAVDDHAMPGQELGSAVDVRGLVDFVLLEPPADAACGLVRPRSREQAPVELDEAIAEESPLVRIDAGDVSTNAVSECPGEVLSVLPSPMSAIGLQNMSIVGPESGIGSAVGLPAAGRQGRDVDPGLSRSE